jgi:NADH:ubiquinone oxidoreductase subunit H
MYLSIILTIFVVLQITTLVLIYKWWNKYGRKLFTTFTDMKGPKGPNPFGNIPDMGAMMKQFENMTKNMGRK